MLEVSNATAQLMLAVRIVSRLIRSRSISGICLVSMGDIRLWWHIHRLDLSCIVRLCKWGKSLLLRVSSSSAFAAAAAHVNTADGTAAAIHNRGNHKKHHNNSYNDKRDSSGLTHLICHTGVPVFERVSGGHNFRRLGLHVSSENRYISHVLIMTSIIFYKFYRPTPGDSAFK